jgi:hypothetical protein
LSSRQYPSAGKRIDPPLYLHAGERQVSAAGGWVDRHDLSTRAERAADMADTRIGGIGLGGILVILGIVLIIVWSFWWGLIIALIGLIAFGGFAKGKWY